MVLETQGKVNNLSDAIKASRRKKKIKNVHIVDKKEIPGDKNAYVYRNAQRDGKCTLYFYHRYSV